jgi:hypothetical protein
MEFFDSSKVNQGSRSYFQQKLRINLQAMRARLLWTRTNLAGNFPGLVKNKQEQIWKLSRTFDIELYVLKELADIDLQRTKLTSSGFSSTPRKESTLTSAAWRRRAERLWNMKITGIPTNVATSSVMTKTLVTLSFHQAAIFSWSLFQVPEAVCYNYLQSTACNSTELHFAGTLTIIVRIDIGELLLRRCIIIEWISSSSSSILWYCLFSLLLRLERTTKSNRSDQELNMGPSRPTSFTNVVLMKDWHGEPNLLLHEDSSTKARTP